jgi:hypothetical protein
MIPSRTWFPSSLQERVAWFNNFNNQMQAIGTTLGFTAGELAALTADQQVMEFLGNTMPALVAYSKSVRDFKDEWTQGDIGDPASTFPADVSFTPPSPIPATGCFERLDQMVKRIRTAPAYNEETGSLLGIIPQKGDDLVEADMKPAIKPSATPGSNIDVQFTRGQADGILIESKVDNAAGWNTEGRFLKSPFTISIPDGNGMPHSVQLRARYFIGNDLVGVYSEIYTIITTP